MRKRKKKQQLTTGDALVEIAGEDAGALKLVGDIMERNARELDSNFAMQLKAEEQDHAATKLELQRAEYRLNDLRERVAWLMGGELPQSLRDEIESIVEDEISEAEMRR